ncbi:MAG: pyruvate kinase [Bacteroidales bacterium]
MQKTKIVATISDRQCDINFIQQLYEQGMNVVRLNTAHQQPEDTLKVIKNVQNVSERIALLIDTKGPEVRTVDSPNVIELYEGEEIDVEGNPDKHSEGKNIYVSYPGFADDLKEGNNFLIDDGEIELRVVEKKGKVLRCRVLNSGIVKPRKSVNTPNVDVNLPSVSEKDKKFIHLAAKHDIDFIAHSFVRSKEDVLAVQKILDKENSDIKIIAKIENQQGVDNIDQILELAYGIMVARGDLAIEIPYEKIPGIQKMLINKCIEKRKPVIIATQMLHSMIKSPRPTRAEVNDVASAIYSQADALMLSGETANGKYPVEALKTMATVAKEVENSKDPFNDIPIKVINNKISDFLCKSAVQASINLEAEAIIADSTSGRTIRSISAYRGTKPIFAQCYSKRTMRELQLSYGVITDYMKPRETSHEFLLDAIDHLQDAYHFNNDDLLVVLAGNFGRSYGASYIEIGTIKNLVGHLAKY